MNEPQKNVNTNTRHFQKASCTPQETIIISAENVTCYEVIPTRASSNRHWSLPLCLDTTPEQSQNTLEGIRWSTERPFETTTASPPMRQYTLFTKKTKTQKLWRGCQKMRTSERWSTHLTEVLLRKTFQMNKCRIIMRRDIVRVRESTHELWIMLRLGMVSELKFRMFRK